ncbi:7598_t:CDS:2, partial [Ambispora leptoticha]
MVAPFQPNQSAKTSRDGTMKLSRRSNPPGPTSAADQDEYFESCAIQEFLGHTQTVRTVAWNSDGSKLASGSVDKTVRLWHPDLPTNSERLTGHTDSVDQLCWSPQSNHLLATASGDKTVRFWDTRNNRCVNVTNTTGENINIAWSGNGETVAVGDKDDQITFIDTRHINGRREFKVKKTYKESAENHEEINEISWSMDCKNFFITTGSGAVKVFDWPSMVFHQEAKAHTANCYCIDFDPKGRYWATGGADALVCLFDYEMIGIRSYDSLHFPVRTLSFTHDGTYLASASEDEHIIITNVLTEQKENQEAFRIPTKAATNSVAWNPKNYLLAYAGDEVNPDKSYVGLK